MTSWEELWRGRWMLLRIKINLTHPRLAVLKSCRNEKLNFCRSDPHWGAAAGCFYLKRVLRIRLLSSENHCRLETPSELNAKSFNASLYWSSFRSFRLCKCGKSFFFAASLNDFCCCRPFEEHTRSSWLGSPSHTYQKLIYRCLHTRSLIEFSPATYVAKQFKQRSDDALQSLPRCVKFHN